ncbi:hypothetical protein AAVH_39022 [Aphelenchoides avenae]|nr:hypothetical protein AAVH_39022 [Aphelenchus avenae]
MTRSVPHFLDFPPPYDGETFAKHDATYYTVPVRLTWTKRTPIHITGINEGTSWNLAMEKMKGASSM